MEAHPVGFVVQLDGKIVRPVCRGATPSLVGDGIEHVQQLREHFRVFRQAGLGPRVGVDQPAILAQQQLAGFGFG